MTLQIEKIKDRVRQFSHEKYEGYVCIGRGVDSGLVKELGISYSDIHATGMYHGKMVPKWDGIFKDKLHYITEEYYDYYIKPKTFENTIEQAIALKGKTVGFFDKDTQEPITFIVDKWIVISDNGGKLTIKNIQKFGYSVNLISSGGKGYNIPVNAVEEIKSHTLKLNDEYSAHITKDKVKVGCQTFDLSVVKEIVKLAETL